MKTWDTGTLAPTQQFGYWREVLCEAFTALDSVPQAPRNYRSTVVLHELAEVNAVELSSFAQEVRRGSAEIRRRADEYLFANLQLSGRSTVEQDGRRIEVAPGSFYLVDTTRPYRLYFTEDFCALSFRLPHAQLLPRLRQPRRCTAVRVDAASGLGSLAAAQMQGLMRCAPQLDADAAQRLSSTLAELISISVSGTIPAQEQSRDELRRAFRQMIVRQVRERATDPGLAVEGVAAHFRISPRYLHGVFAEHGTSFTQFVLEHRLTLATQALGDSSAAVTEVALACGFGDPSYFGRVFRRRFGCSPRQWRQSGCRRD
ncbi:helix-turn-helix domain-containing protein [Panacagrimonas sp.]|uniref:helix-turn-helix domain-containing protein n=1 Tax=Panacagrimonas sp. TaxID=2480088 RepID=UPI003B519534